MSAFKPIPPCSATEMFELNPAEGLRIIADLAEAGLVKAYARMIERVQPCGSRESVRDKRIAPEMWRRINSEGKTSDVLTGTVRLEGSPEFGGGPKITLIGIRFDPVSLRKAAEDHGADHVATVSSVSEAKPAKVNPPRQAEDTHLDSTSAPPAPRSSAPRYVPAPSNASLLKVEQAMGLLNMGRTKLYDLVKSEDLELVKIGAASRITRDSIERFLGRRGTSGE